MKKRLFIAGCVLLSAATLAAAEPTTAPVSGKAYHFISGKPVTNASITILENDQKLTTDENGNFGPVQWPVGKPITFVLEKTGYRPTQSATLTVPKEGLTGPYSNVTFQVFDYFTFYTFSKIMGVALDETKCHVGATVTAHGKNLEDLPQGEAGAKVVLSPEIAEKPFYFDIFKDGPMKNYTNPFTRNLTETSEDGGIVLANVEPRDKPYTMIATKDGVTFNKVQFICRKGMFVNLSPPDGPMAQG